MNFYLRWLEEMTKLRGLGKGLDALLKSANVQSTVTESGVTSSKKKTAKSDAVAGVEEISLDKIKPGKYQPRRIFDEDALNELADSIKHNGVIQPILIREHGNHHYELIAGERRFRASKIAGLTHIPAIIRDLSDEEALAISLIENIQRKDLNVIEEARGYKRLIDEFKLIHEELAKVTGRSRSHITNILRLLNLHASVQDMVLAGQMDMGHARALLPLDKHLQLKLANDIIDLDLTTSEVEQRVAKLLHARVLHKSGQSVVTTKVDPDITRLENKIADRLGLMVSIKHGRRGSGRIVLMYNSLDELDNLFKLF